MKTSKRILGIALAVIMIFNVFAVGAFAMPDNCVVDLILDTDKDVYAPGETITLKVSTQVIADVDLMQISGQYEIAYPSAVVEPSATTNVLDDHGFVAIANGYDAGISGVQIPASSSGASVAGTDATICYVVASDPSINFSASAAPVDLFTVNMVIKEDAAPGTYTIAFNPAGYEEYNAFSNDGIDLGGLYGPFGADYGFAQENMYNYGSVTFTIGAGKIVFHEKAQHNTKLTTADVATLGFVGNFDKNDVGGFTFESNGTTLTNVTEVGVTLDIAGVGTQTKTTDAVYLKSGTVYNFRAVLKDLDLAQYGDAKITATYFVTFDKAGVSTTEYSDSVEFTANGIING